MLDLAFAISYFVCLVLLWIFGMNHLNAVWRITLGLGTVPPLLLLYFRLKMKEVSRFVFEWNLGFPSTEDRINISVLGSVLTQ